MAYSLWPIGEEIGERNVQMINLDKLYQHRV